MDVLTKSELKELATKGQGPFVSVYMPTHRGGAQADPIQWRNLILNAEERLVADGLRASDAKNMLGPARALTEESSFWQNQSDGLAFFWSPTFTRFYRLPVPFAPQVLVGVRFHVKPLIPLLSDNGRFFILALSQNKVRLLQGTHYGVHEVDLKNVPKSLEEALRFHDRDEPLLFHTHPSLGLGRWGAMFYGQGVGIDDIKDDILRYFQQIDHGLHELLRGERAPLVLAAVEYLWPIYGKANSYPHLLERGIAGNPDRLSAKDLHDQAWAIVQPHFQVARRKAAAVYDRLAGTGRTCNSLSEIVRAAHQGQLEVLFVALDKERWGTFDAATEVVAEHEEVQQGDEDLLNLAAAQTLAMGGAVHGVKSEDIPGHGLAAAVLWLPLAKRT